EDAVRGFGFAQMAGHAEQLLLNVASARGRRAEYFGPGPADANVNNDVRVRTVGIPARAALWLRTGDAEQQRYLEAFARGANDHAERHGDTIDPQIRKVLPLQPEDGLVLYQYYVTYAFLSVYSDISEYVWKEGIKLAMREQENRPALGSNGWAVGPRKTQS